MFRENRFVPLAIVLRTKNSPVAAQRGWGICTRCEMGTICPFGIFPCFTVVFASKLVIFPLNVFWELEKAIFSGPRLETNLASRWEGVRLPRASGKSPDFPGSSPNFPGSFSATFPEVLSLWNLTAIQGFPGSFPDFPGSFPDFPRGQPLALGSLTPSSDSQKLSLTKRTNGETGVPRPQNHLKCL